MSEPNQSSRRIRFARRRVNPKQGRLTSLGKAVNSSLGIWLLSTVFVSFGSWAYTIWTEDRKREEAKSTAIMKLDTEIKSRFYYDRLNGGVDLDFFMVGIRRLSRFTIDYKQREEIYQGILDPPPKNRVMYPEYSDRGLLSLLEELKGLEEGQDKKCIELAIAGIRRTMQRMLTLSTSADTIGEALARVKVIADYRWSKEAERGRFAYQQFIGPKLNNREPTKCPVEYLENYDPFKFSGRRQSPF